jgi:reverse gyrase
VDIATLEDVVKKGLNDEFTLKQLEEVNFDKIIKAIRCSRRSFEQELEIVYVYF